MIEVVLIILNDIHMIHTVVSPPFAFLLEPPRFTCECYSLQNNPGFENAIVIFLIVPDLPEKVKTYITKKSYVHVQVYIYECYMINP